MKKKLLTSTSACKKYFLVFLLLTGICGYINAQKNPNEGKNPQNTIIKWNTSADCPNLPDTLPGQVNDPAHYTIPTSSGDPWFIPPISAQVPGGGAYTLSIASIMVTTVPVPPAHGTPIASAGCDNSNSTPPPPTCSSFSTPLTYDGIIYTIAGGSTPTTPTLTITGTPNKTRTYLITVRACVGGTGAACEGGTFCEKTFTLNVYASAAIRGDPHITTVDGIHYDFQAVGEFVALRDSAGSFEIQTRQTAVAAANPAMDPYTGLKLCVSVNTAVAAHVGTQQVSYEPIINEKPDANGMQLWVDGDPGTYDENGIIDLGSGGRITKSPAGGGVITIDFPDGASLLVVPTHWFGNQWYLDLSIYRTSATKGLMGIIPPGSWLPALPDGTSVGTMPTSPHALFVQLYETFADAWRVTDGTRLFHNGSTATYTDTTWPAENAKSCSVPGQTPLPPIGLEVAEQLCRDILDSSMRADAIFDVMVTGDSGFVKGYLLTQRVKTSTTATTVNASKDITKVDEPVTFTATVSRKFLSGKDVLTGSVEFTVDGKGFGQVKLEADGHATLTTTSLEAGGHQIAAKFIPSSGSTAFSSSSLNITHTVLADGNEPWWKQIWVWICALIAIILGWFGIKKKKTA